IEVLLAYEIAGGGLHPFRFYTRRTTRIKPRRLDQFGRQHPPGLFFAQPGTRKDGELDAARAKILAGLLAPAPDIAQEARDERAMDLLVARPLLVDAHVHFTHQRRELAMDVAPFAQAALRQELLA